jgi:hypothetical protein
VTLYFLGGGNNNFAPSKVSVLLIGARFHFRKDEWRALLIAYLAYF